MSEKLYSSPDDVFVYSFPCLHQPYIIDNSRSVLLEKKKYIVYL